jgi:multiple sugar transport system permease protein/sorbitol/mannitol transport system permease protein
MSDATSWPLKVAGGLIVWISIAIALVPLIFLLLTSIKPAGDAQAIPPKWVFLPTLEHYAAVFGGETSSSQAFLPLLWHSAVVAVSATALTILVGLPAAYALARVRFKGRRFLATWVLSTIMFPPIVAAIPIFIFAGQLQIIDTYPIMIIPYTAFNLPLVIWLLRSFITQIPAEIEDAARVDGCSRIGILRRIILPLTVPGMAAGAILSLILCWNEFLFALTLTRSDVKTAPVGINEFTGMFGTQWGNLTAASTAIVAPILVMTLVLRRRLISGLTLGAVK